MEMPQETQARAGKDIVKATREFAQEIPARSWAYLISTLMLLAIALGAAALVPFWPLRLAASILAALLLVRGFILYHDFMHGAILRKSGLGKAILYGFSSLVLTPPTSWRETHNYHHANIGKISGPSIGSFPILTVEDWKKASSMGRFRYRLSRHPLTIAGAYVTVFLLTICLGPFFKNPRKHWDSALAVLAHVGTAALLTWSLGVDALLFAFLIPVAVASALGAYLFYAQHNFPGMHVLSEGEWDFYRAALESSSYLKLGPVLRWFTGSIGYHHVHHLNPGIPFYRLQEAMAAIPELQHPTTTTLYPRDVLACLRMNLWDPAQGRMISFRDAEP